MKIYTLSNQMNSNFVGSDDDSCVGVVFEETVTTTRARPIEKAVVRKVPGGRSVEKKRES
jgi:hypothetical protein